MGRELCLFMAIDAGNAPVKERNDLVALAVRRAAPFPDPDFGLAWTGENFASVWFWPRNEVASRLGSELESRSTQYVPEGTFTGSPIEEGTQLLALSEGFEGRVWKQHRLVASRWWQAPPEPAQWRAFVRSSGWPDSDIPALTSAPILARSWSVQRERRPLFATSGLDTYLPRLAWSAGVLACLVFAFQLGSIGRNLFDTWRSERAALDLDAPLKRILQAREATDLNMARINQLLALHQGRPQMELMAEASKLMPGGDWEILRWTQPTPDRLELTLRMPAANPEKLVADWEASPLFRSVTTDLQGTNGLVSIRATIEPVSGDAAQ